MSQGDMRASEMDSPPSIAENGTIALVLNFTSKANTMRIAAFFYKDQPHVGLVSQDLNSVTPFDLPLADRELGALTLVDTLSRGEALPAQGAAIALKDVQLRAPLPHPRRNIFCVGKNYHAHAKEFARSGFDSSAKAGGEIPAEPIIFSKVPECVIATGEAIEMPAVSTAIDYEAELAVIIGKGGKGITKADAMKHVWGYTIGNDVSARDAMFADGQWARAKGFDTFCPLGPWIETDLDPQNVEISTFVDGEPRRHGNTKDMIHPIAEIMTYVTNAFTLLPGDVILTGTPAGLGGFIDGQTVDITISGIGTLSNPARNRDDRP